MVSILTLLLFFVRILLVYLFGRLTENMPDSQSSAYSRKHYHLFKQPVLGAHIRKNTKKHIDASVK